MNPFTRFIARKSRDRQLRAFIEHWDRLERLVIHVYRAKEATAEDEAEYREIRAWLAAAYPRWEASLAPLWPQTRVAGKPATTDPFAYLIAPESAADFVSSWSAMQHLPAAREALNQFILARSER